MTLGLLTAAFVLTVGPVSTSADVDVGFQAPPLRFPTLLVSHALTEEVRLSLGLTHQRSDVRQVTRVSVLGQRTLAPVERGPWRIVPTLGGSAELGLTTVSVQDSSSTTPVAALRLIGGAQHELQDAALTLFVRVWNGFLLRPFGTGWGIAVGFRTPVSADLLGELRPSPEEVTD